MKLETKETHVLVSAEAGYDDNSTPTWTIERSMYLLQKFLTDSTRVNSRANVRLESGSERLPATLIYVQLIVFFWLWDK